MRMHLERVSCYLWIFVEILVNILLDILMDIPVLYNNSLKITQGRKRNCKKRKNPRLQPNKMSHKPGKLKFLRSQRSLRSSQGSARKCYHRPPRPLPAHQKKTKGGTKDDQYWVPGSSAGCILWVHGGELSPLVHPHPPPQAHHRVHDTSLPYSQADEMVTAADDGQEAGPSGIGRPVNQNLQAAKWKRRSDSEDSQAFILQIRQCISQQSEATTGKSDRAHAAHRWRCQVSDTILPQGNDCHLQRHPQLTIVWVHSCCQQKVQELL